MDAPGNDGNASMPEQVKRPNPWRKKMMMHKWSENFTAEEWLLVKEEELALWRGFRRGVSLVRKLVRTQHTYRRHVQAGDGYLTSIPSC